jgi:hypothetical protein
MGDNGRTGFASWNFMIWTHFKDDIHSVMWGCAVGMACDSAVYMLQEEAHNEINYGSQVA